MEFLYERICMEFHVIPDPTDLRDLRRPQAGHDMYPHVEHRLLLYVLRMKYTPSKALDIRGHLSM